MKFNVFVYEPDQDEARAVIAFLQWQNMFGAVYHDPRHVLTSNSGSISPVMEYKGREVTLVLKGFKGMYKYFEDNGLFYC